MKQNLKHIYLMCQMYLYLSFNFYLTDDKQSSIGKKGLVD